jgi:hypothetical protein
VQRDAAMNERQEARGEKREEDLFLPHASCFSLHVRA